MAHPQELTISLTDPQEAREALAKRRKSLEYGRSLIKTRLPQEMVSTPQDDLPGRIRSQLWSDIGTVLHNEAEPFDSVPPAHFKQGIECEVRVFAARDSTENDLVECEWTYLERRIAVTMTINARRIDFDLRQVPACAQDRETVCVNEVRSWVESVVALEGVDSYQYAYRIDLPWPDELSEGTTFSSAPDLDILNVFRWHLRVDAEMRNDVLSIYVYKRIAQLASYQDASKWFSDDFRAEIHERARKLGKLPPKPEAEED